MIDPGAGVPKIRKPSPVVNEGIPMADQDAVRDDPEHYTVAAEDERVRVVRIRYGVGEKSVMHAHPASVVVALDDNRARFIDEAGKTEELEMKAGGRFPAARHDPPAGEPGRAADGGDHHSWSEPS